jgi:dephospho-CoA kinase
MIVGLTGGIASGKSLVASMLREMGARLIDADQIAREVVTPGSGALREIATRFGETVLQADGALDRAAMAARIFSDPQARAALNAIMHPRVRARIAERIRDLRAAEPEAIVVVDVALLLDVAAPSAYAFDGIVVVFVDEPMQLRRLMDRDALTADAARQRLASQRPLREKIAEATWVIDNTGTPTRTREQVDALWRSWPPRAPHPNQPTAPADN